MQRVFDGALRSIAPVFAAGSLAVEYRTPRGRDERFLSNDFSLEPGVLAFIYWRRWEEEKAFDVWKNDLAMAKAWREIPCGNHQPGAVGHYRSLNPTVSYTQFSYKNLGIIGMTSSVTQTKINELPDFERVMTQWC